MGPSIQPVTPREKKKVLRGEKIAVICITEVKKNKGWE